MVGNNYDSDDFEIAEYKGEDEDEIDIHDSDNDTSLTTKSKEKQLNENSLYDMWLSYNEIQKARDGMSNSMKYSIELLTLLQNSNVSGAALYDNIVDCLSGCKDADALSYLPKCKPMLKKRKKRYSMDGAYLTNTKCYLPNIGLPIYVPVNCFLNSIFSLLTATGLMKSNNLLFHDTRNPSYVSTYKPDSPLADINTGDAYYRYYDLLVDKANSIIIPLMIFADGMLIDKNGRLVQEPWMYTLGIFTRSACNQARAWGTWDLTKINAKQCYSNDQIKQTKQHMKDSGIRILKQNDDDFVNPDMLD